MDTFLEYIIDNNLRVMLFCLSVALTIYSWYYIARSKEILPFKLFGLLIAVVPFIGLFIVLWIFNIPGKQSKEKQATMNHYGLGGKFIGGGDNAYTFTDYVTGSDDDKNK